MIQYIKNKINQLLNKKYKEPKLGLQFAFSEEQTEYLVANLKEKQSKAKIIKGKYQLDNWRWSIGLVSTILHKRPLLDKDFLDFLQFDDTHWEKETVVTTEFNPLVEEINEDDFYYGAQDSEDENNEDKSTS